MNPKISRLQEKIIKEVAPKLQQKFGFDNIHSIPKLVKVVINVGIRSDIKDPKAIDSYVENLKLITGQQPVKTRAKKSISSFKLRQGQVNGLVVTLRGRRMYEFLDKLLNVTLARVRDFRGLSEAGFDSKGNYSLGFRDQTPFPEISAEDAKHLFGLQVTVVVDAPKKEHAKEFLKLIGLPLKADKPQTEKADK